MSGNNMSDFEPHIKALTYLPFDQFIRQYLVYRAVKQAYGSKKLSILDIGGYGGKTREFFKHDEVLVVDLFDADEPGYQTASALDLPFADKSFDVVLSFDVLEHIKAPQREKFVGEALRVTKNLLVIAAPFYTAATVRAEKILNQHHQAISGEKHRWLEEHIEYGLPDSNELERLLSQRGYHYVLETSNNLELWMLLQFTVFHATTASIGLEAIGNLFEFYNQNFQQLGDASGTTYRRIYYIASDKKRLPTIEKPAVPNPLLTQDLMRQLFTSLHKIENIKVQRRTRELQHEINWLNIVLQQKDVSARRLSESHHKLQQESLRIRNALVIKQLRAFRRLALKLRKKLSKGSS